MQALMQNFALFGNNLTANINISRIIKMLDALSPEDRLSLYQLLGVQTQEDIHQLLGQGTMEEPISFEQRMVAYSDYRMSKALLVYIPPIIILLGTFGNILTFIILMRRGMRKYSTYLYLAVLSVTDILVLYVGLLQLWVRELTGYDLRAQADWLCKLNTVITYTVSDYSVWLILGVTSERYIATCHPLKAPSWCNRSRAIKVIILFLLVLFSVNAHFFWTSQVQTINQNLNCAGGADYATLVEEVWPWVDACIYSFFPFVAILILNSLIIRQVLRARKYRREVTTSAGSQQDGRRVKTKSHEKSTKLTVMLLTISFAFLITTLPMNSVLIGTVFWGPYVKNDPENMAKIQLVRTITELLMYVNHSMNFFLYCATGQKFRHQLCLLMCRNYRSGTGAWLSETHNPHRNGVTGKTLVDLQAVGNNHVEYSKVKNSEDQL